MRAALYITALAAAFGGALAASPIHEHANVHALKHGEYAAHGAHAEARDAHVHKLSVDETGAGGSVDEQNIDGDRCMACRAAKGKAPDAEWRDELCSDCFE